MGTSTYTWKPYVAVAKKQLEGGQGASKPEVAPGPKTLQDVIDEEVNRIKMS
jgi:hypothetical protein